MLSYLKDPFSYRIQKTLKREIQFSGKGLHSGENSHVVLVPSDANKGIVFQKKTSKKKFLIQAGVENIVATDMATTVGIEGEKDSYIATVEHLISALFGIGLTNIMVVVEGNEIPILDGSAYPFVEACLSTGIVFQNYSTPVLKVMRPIYVHKQGSACELLPCNRLRVTSSIEFSHPLIKQQTFALDLTPQNFIDLISKARTFGFEKDLKVLQEKKLAKGADLSNVLAYSENAILNSEGSRFDDECVRHKILDAIGDLSLFGCLIEGELVSFKGGHKIHLELLKTLKSDQRNLSILPSERVSAPLSAVENFSTL